MKNRSDFVLAIKEKYAKEVKETELLDTVQRKILDYFDEIRASLQNEFKKAPSLSLQIRGDHSTFLSMSIENYGIEFEREAFLIKVSEILENGKRRPYDTIYVSNFVVVTEMFQRTTFTTSVLDKYLIHIFNDYLK